MASIQHYCEEIKEVFGRGITQILAELDRAQKSLNEEVRYLQAVGQLNSPSTNTGWALPSDFRSLIDILFYDLDNNPLYMGDFNYAYEIVNGKFYIYSLTSTPITGLDASIITAYILYEKNPTSITSISDTFELPVAVHDGILAKAYQNMYMKYPVSQVVGGTPIQAISPTLATMWEKEYLKYKRKLLIMKNTQDTTHKEAIFYPYAGKIELPRRINDALVSTILYPVGSLYTKYARWTLTYPSTATEVIAPIGYTGTITATIVANQLTISSTESDFSTIADFNSNNPLTINSFSSTSWVFDLPASWGTIRFEIFE